jgi:predicted nucleic acid-binding protein
MGAVLFDTSVYITALRTRVVDAVNLRLLAAGAPVWMSSVVLQELYAGVHARDTRVLERLERDFTKAKRVVVPSLNDWTLAGKILARFSSEYDYEEIGKARLTNDALLAMSAARLGITIVTANKRDFARLAKLRPFSWRVGIDPTGC